MLQSPPTPTQDEQVEYSTSEVTVETGIPIVEVQTAAPVHRTRSRTKVTESEPDRPVTPVNEAPGMCVSRRNEKLKLFQVSTV